MQIVIFFSISLDGPVWINKCKYKYLKSEVDHLIDMLSCVLNKLFSMKL